MSKMIHDYNAAVSVDGVADYLLIDPASTGVYKKISRSILLGVAGTPMDISTVQSVTNKTLDNTNQATLKSNKFTLQDSSDTTKQAVFSVAGVTTATTRTYTLPNGSVTLASLTGTETLTNKSLTSPVITGGSIDNSTITVDSISGHTTSTIVTVGGVQFNNGTIGTNNAVVTAAIADSAITPAKLQTGTGTGWAWQNWTVTFSAGITIGNGVITARYSQIGKLTFCYVQVVFGSTSTMSSNGVAFNLPTTCALRSARSHMGNGLAIGTSNEFPVYVEYSTQTAGIIYLSDNGTLYGTISAFSSTAPFTWGNGNTLTANFCYETA